MNPMLGLALAGLFLLVFLRPIVALLLGDRIAKTVIARQPDRIHLQPAGPGASRHPDQIEESARALQREGFADAGGFTVAEMEGVVLRLLVHERECWQAVLYEHPVVGRWLELILVFPDRSRLTFTGTRETGLAPLPTVRTFHLPGLSTESILQRARAERARRDDTPVPVSVAGAAAAYEEGFAEIMALRKAKGISRAEVAAVSLRPRPRPKRAA